MPCANVVRVSTSSPTPRHRQARTIFWSVSALGVVIAIVLGHAVILPFLMAALVGYVLFPLVRRIERLRVPR